MVSLSSGQYQPDEESLSSSGGLTVPAASSSSDLRMYLDTSSQLTGSTQEMREYHVVMPQHPVEAGLTLPPPMPASGGQELLDMPVLHIPQTASVLDERRPRPKPKARSTQFPRATSKTQVDSHGVLQEVQPQPLAAVTSSVVQPPPPAVAPGARARPDIEAVQAHQCPGGHRWSEEHNKTTLFQACKTCRQRRHQRARNMDCDHPVAAILRNQSNSHGSWVQCKRCQGVLRYWPAAMGQRPRSAPPHP